MKAPAIPSLARTSPSLILFLSEPLFLEDPDPELNVGVNVSYAEFDSEGTELGVCDGELDTTRDGVAVGIGSTSAVVFDVEGNTVGLGDEKFEEGALLEDSIDVGSKLGVNSASNENNNLTTKSIASCAT